MKTRTQAQLQKGKVLIEALQTLFRPYVEAACSAKIAAFYGGPPPQLDIDDEGIEMLADMTRQAGAEAGAPSEEIEAEVEKLKEGIRNPQPFTADEIVKIVAEEVDTECGQLVSNWLNAYFLADDDENGDWKVAAKDIDDAMLPPMNFVLTHGFPDGQTAEDLFVECCGQGHLDADASRAVLRQVRASLPPGQLLPAEAVEFLALEGVIIVL